MNTGPPTIDFDMKTPDEIRSMTDALRNEAARLKEDQDVNEKKVREGRENVRKLIPDVTEIQAIAERRSLQLDKKLRLERKILSIYNRFPNILVNDQPQIISTDISILNRQLEIIKKREETAKNEITEITKKQEHLEQTIVDLSRQLRLQKDLMEQRDNDKEQLRNNLKQELEASRTLYLSDGRQIDKKTTIAESVTVDMRNQLEAYKTQFDNMTRQRASILNSSPAQNAQIAAQIASRQKDLISALETFSVWWSNRRRLRHYTDREEFLKGVMEKTQTRYDSSYKSIEFIKRGNASRVEEKNSLRNMNGQLNNSIEEKKIRRTQLEDRRNEIQKSFKPLPKDVDTQLKSLKNQKISLENRAKSLEIELQVLGVSSGPSRAETRYEDARRHFRTQSQIAAKLKKSIDGLKKKSAEQNSAPKNTFVASLAAIQDSRILLAEDIPNIVQAAPLDLLEKIIFNPANDDRDYNPGLLVYLHTEKIDLQPFVQNLIVCFNTTEFYDQREERLKRFVDIWRNWFPNDFQDVQTRSTLSPLINLVGVTGIYDVQTPMKLTVSFNINVPFNAKETRIPFCTSPLILAEHFTYSELNILKEIQTSEYVGCGWTKSDKWTKSPHIMKMTEHFNFVVQWIVFQIVSLTSLEDRVALLERWILIMDAAAEIINFQLVFEIMGALSNPAITHLKKTWEGLNPTVKDLYHKYSSMTAPSSRFASYRAELEKFQPETIVPYIGPFLTSLVYIADGNPSKKTLPGSTEPVVNFQKFRSSASVLRELMVQWGKDMVFYLHEDLLKRVHTIPPVELSDSELFQRSQQLKD